MFKLELIVLSDRVASLIARSGRHHELTDRAAPLIARSGRHHELPWLPQQ